MISPDKKFTTNAKEVMQTGTDAIMDMMVKRPACMLIEDQLTELVALLAAKLVIRKEKNN